ncbi:sulfatase-like hydrolase/transferase [Cognatishimia activa]|uniref:sulfatase-like hydrolase/transferase n=1 Tax=Cognatishimia activa TaxID=1715691 RepID=UPI00223292B0|nr:sulfatase-like hydrolase/transferase [Cognatishimia activa]UZD91660.1 sulfatase-like hydrolase/transferase [Cognatishimia activa]
MRRLLLSVSVLSGLPTVGLSQPNILMILADDMGADVSPCIPEATKSVRMPTLKALCADGMVFDNAHAYPTCSPSRASMITGFYASRTGVGAPVSRENGSLSGSYETVFDHLSDVGYASAVIGKWHLTSDRRDGDHPGALGIPYYYGPFGGGVRDYENWSGFENGTPVRVTKYTTTAFVDKAESWIKDQTQPWFLWLALNAPHAPFHSPPDDLHSFGNLSPSPERRSDVRNHYFAALEAVDTEVDRLLSSLPDETRENTVVVFAGDNGTPSQVSRRLGLTRDAKGSIYQGGTHVPLVFSGPGVANGRNSDPVQITDLFETFLGLAGSSATTTDSDSLTAALTGRSVNRPATYIEHFSKSEARGNPIYGWTIQTDDYALIAPEGQAPELYDAKKDRKQRRNLAARNPEVVEQLTALRRELLQQ